MTEHPTTEDFMRAVDMLSFGVVVGTLTAILPPFAALLTIVWTGIRIYETHTVQRWLGKIPPKQPEGD
jgi:hypothetical protein